MTYSDENAAIQMGLSGTDQRGLLRPYDVQHWDGRHWYTVTSHPTEGAAMWAAATQAKVRTDVRVAKDEISLARWLFGQRTIR